MRIRVPIGTAAMKPLRGKDSPASRAALRRAVRVCVAALSLLAALMPAAAAPQQTIAVMNCALIDDNAEYNDADLTHTQLARAAMISDTLRAQLQERALY